MAEIVLALVVVVLLVERAFAQRDHNREVGKLLNRLAANSVSELAVLNHSEAPKAKTPDKPPRQIPIGL